MLKGSIEVWKEPDGGFIAILRGEDGNPTGWYERAVTPAAAAGACLYNAVMYGHQEVTVTRVVFSLEPGNA
jgi:hypothetical protein